MRERMKFSKSKMKINNQVSMKESIPKKLAKFETHVSLS